MFWKQGLSDEPDNQMIHEFGVVTMAGMLEAALALETLVSNLSCDLSGNECDGYASTKSMILSSNPWAVTA